MNRFSCNSNCIRVTGQESQDLSPFPETRRNKQSQTRRKTMQRACGETSTRLGVNEGGGPQLCLPPSDHPIRDTSWFLGRNTAHCVVSAMVTGTGGAPWQHNHDTCITCWNWNKKTDFPFPGQPCYQRGKIPGVKRLVFHLTPHGTMPPKANSRENAGVGRPQQQVTPLQVP